MYSFKTISGPSDGLYKEKGSRFLAFAYPVTGEDEIKQILAAVQKKYYDARHHCFAWMLGPERKQFRAFDDGEPNHSAGDPILGQIRSMGITNVLVVVVRYFGGTKLGVAGLVNAYRSAAADVLKRSEIVGREVMGTLVIDHDYDATPGIRRLIREFQLHITEETFGEAVPDVSRISSSHAVGFV